MSFRLIKPSKLKKLINQFYLVLVSVLTVYIVFSDGLSVKPLKGLIALIISKDFLLAFIVYTAIFGGYVYIVKFVLEKFFDAFIKLIGEDYTLIISYIGKKQALMALGGLIIARKYGEIVHFIMNKFTSFFTDSEKYLVGTHTSKVIVSHMNQAISYSNNLISIGLIAILATIGSSMYLGHVKKMNIIKYNVIEPSTILIRKLPYLCLVYFVFQVLINLV